MNERWKYNKKNFHCIRSRPIMRKRVGTRRRRKATLATWQVPPVLAGPHTADGGGNLAPCLSHRRHASLWPPPPPLAARGPHGSAASALRSVQCQCPPSVGCSPHGGGSFSPSNFFPSKGRRIATPTLPSRAPLRVSRLHTFGGHCVAEEVSNVKKSSGARAWSALRVRAERERGLRSGCVRQLGAASAGGAWAAALMAFMLARECGGWCWRSACDDARPLRPWIC